MTTLTTLRRYIWLPFALLLFGAATAEASHFRFAHTTWRRVSGNTVEFTSTQAWRFDAVATLPIDFGDGFSGVGPVNTIGTFADISGEQYTIIQYKVQHTYASEGPFTAFSESCCRIYSLLNASGASERIETVVDLRNGNQGSPVSSIPVIVQMAQGGLRTVVLPVADPDGDTFTCRMATSGESQIPSVANAGGFPLSISSGCVLSWNTTGTAVGQKYAAQVVIEEVHAGVVSRVALDFIVEITDPTQGAAPVCAGTSGLVVLNVGQPFAGNFTGTDADGGNLTVSHLGLPPGATLTPPSGSTQAQPFNSSFNWTPQLSDAGSAHAVTIVYTDPGNLQGTCSFSLRVTQCGDGIVDANAGEDCEDGNATDCDGCSNCHFDACGDGVLCDSSAQAFPEECDDGNTTPGDGCSATCQSEAACGDGVVDAGEACDDGNTDDCDGCTDCQADACGDGVLCDSAGAAFPEGCDDGNTNNCDGCSAACEPDACGDGIVCQNSGEECDDGNVVPADGCDATCQSEPRCGDGVVDPGETCDDGNVVAGDGCSATCQTEALCGNGVIDPGETCDDGGTAPGYCGTLLNPSPDTCSSTCQALICKDPAKIRFVANGPDVLKAHGKLEPTPEGFDPSTGYVAIKLENANGVIYYGSMGAGSLRKVGRSFRFTDKRAKATGTASEGIAMLKVRQKGNFATFTLQVYGDLSAATVAEMKLTIEAGGKQFAIRAPWKRTGSGWSLAANVLPPQ